MFTDSLPIAVPAALGLSGLLFTPAVDRWVKRLERWQASRVAEWH